MFIYNILNPLTGKLFNWNFHPLKVVSRWRDPQLQTQTQNNLFVPQQQKTHTHVTKIYKYILICVVRIRRPALRSMLIAIMQATS